jgi:hypothetical protein
MQAQTLFPVEVKGKFGYMNNEGSISIPAIYDYADDFSEGHAVVALNRMPCLINMQNKRIIDTGLYQNIGMLSEGLISVTDFKRNKYYINLKNEPVIQLPGNTYEARTFRHGYAVVSRQVEYHETKFGKDVGTVIFVFGYIDRSGRQVSSFDYEDADDFFNGFARVKKGGRFGMINTRMQEVIPAQFERVGDVSQNRIVVSENNKFGALDTNGRWAIKPVYELLFPATDGMLGFMQKNQFGFIDVNGGEKVPAVYAAIKPFAEGKAAVLKDGKWGFINASNEWVLRNVFDDASVFSEGMCAILYKRQWGFIDATGKVVIPTQFDAVGSFSNGIADVVYRDIPLYINKRGEFLPILK